MDFEHFDVFQDYLTKIKGIAEVDCDEKAVSIFKMLIERGLADLERGRFQL